MDQFLYKTFRFADRTIDRIVLLVSIILAIIGFYFLSDALYVFNSSSSAGMSKFRFEIQNNIGALKEISGNCVGWIWVEDTNIDYPLMQGETNSTYLNINPYGEYAIGGSIFLDSRNDPELKDSYSLVYGHHMNNGIMFGALDKFYDKDYLEQHRIGKLYMANGETYEMHIFCSIITDANIKLIFDPNGSAPVLEYAKENHEVYLEPENDHIIALSTCKDPGSTTRTVVLATLHLTDEVHDKELEEGSVVNTLETG